MSFEFGHVHLKSKDPAKTARLYLDTLGAKLIEESHGGAQFRLDLHGVRIHITGFIASQTREQRYGIEHLSLETDALDPTIGRIVAGGGRLLEQFTATIAGRNRRVAFVEDADGIQLELVER